jgi:hypothetical protein
MRRTPFKQLVITSILFFSLLQHHLNSYYTSIFFPFPEGRMQLISIYNSLWQGANHDNQQIALTSVNSFVSEGFSDAEKNWVTVVITL